MNAGAAALVVVMAAAVPSPQHPPQPKPPLESPGAQEPKPVFRSGVDLLALDVSVVDKDGRPVPGLAPADFSVEVGGKRRTIVRAEYIDFTQAVSAGSELSDVSSNQTQADAPEPRSVLLLVDDLSFNPSEGKAVFMGLADQVERLFPRDPLGFAPLSGRGPVVEFTTDRKPVAAALRRLIGGRTSLAAAASLVRLGLEEAMAIERGDSTVLEQAIARECAGETGPALDACRNDVQSEVRTIVDEAEREADQTLQALARVFDGMASLPGAKYVLFVSPGIPVGRSPALATALARNAAASGVQLHAFYVERNEAVDASRDRVSPFAAADADVRAQGLELAVGAAGGAVHRIVGDPSNAIERVRREMSGMYRLGVQLELADADGRPRSIEVKVNRRGVTTRSYRQVITPASTAALTPAERLKRALSSPLTDRELGVRLAAFTYRDDGGGGRVMVSAEADAPPEGLRVAYVIRDPRGKPASSGELNRDAVVLEKDAPPLIVFAIPVPPGQYTVKLVLVDAEGRVGSATRAVSVPGGIPATMALGDVLVLPGGTEAVHARPSARIAQGSKQAAVYFELYGGRAAPQNATVQVEISDAPEGPALVTSKAAVGLKTRGKLSRASGQLRFSPAALPPGRYFARVSVEEVSDARAVRGFTIVSGSAAALLSDQSRALVPTFSLNRFLSAPLLHAVSARLEQGAGDDAAVKNVGLALQDGTWRDLTAVTGNPVADSTLRGLQALAAGQPADAERAFRDALEADPEFTLALALAGGAWAAVGRDLEASRSWRTSLATGIDAPFLYTQVADALLRNGDVKGMREFLAELRESGADTAAIERQAAWAAAIAGDRRPAVAALAPWVDSHPEDDDAAFLLVLALYELKTIDKDAAAAAQFDARAKRYVERGGPRQALVGRWMK